MHSHSITSYSLRPHRLQPARLLCQWDFPGKNTGVGSHSLLPGDLANPETEPGSPALQADSLSSEPSSSANKTNYTLNIQGQVTHIL